MNQMELIVSPLNIKYLHNFFDKDPEEYCYVKPYLYSVGGILNNSSR